MLLGAVSLHPFWQHFLPWIKCNNILENHQSEIDQYFQHIGRKNVFGQFPAILVAFSSRYQIYQFSSYTHFSANLMHWEKLLVVMVMVWWGWSASFLVRDIFFHFVICPLGQSLANLCQSHNWLGIYSHICIFFKLIGHKMSILYLVLAPCWLNSLEKMRVMMIMFQCFITFIIVQEIV